MKPPTPWTHLPSSNSHCPCF